MPTLEHASAFASWAQLSQAEMAIALAHDARAALAEAVELAAKPPEISESMIDVLAFEIIGEIVEEQTFGDDGLNALDSQDEDELTNYYAEFQEWIEMDLIIRASIRDNEMKRPIVKGLGDFFWHNRT